MEVTEAPGLQVMILAYTPEAFQTILREGLRAEEEENQGGAMEEMSDSFKYFTGDEIAAIYAYLSTLEPAEVDGG